MSIRPVDLSGMIQRTQDIGNIKHAEDSRPIVDQYNIEVRQEKQESDLSHKVQDLNDTAARRIQKESSVFHCLVLLKGIPIALQQSGTRGEIPDIEGARTVSADPYGPVTSRGHESHMIVCCLRRLG